MTLILRKHENHLLLCNITNDFVKCPTECLELIYIGDINSLQPGKCLELSEFCTEIAGRITYMSVFFALT